MIICICNNISSTDIEAEIDRGTVDISRLSFNLKMNNECKKCKEIIENMIQEKGLKNE